MIAIESKINIKTKYLILIELLLKLLNIVSIGLFYPFFLYLRYVLVYSKTSISGLKLRFKGNLLLFYLKYFSWYFLTLITLGTYRFFLEFKLYKWAISCTYIQESNGESYFSRDELESLLLNILCTFLLIITLGLSFPLVKCIKYRYRARNTFISGHQLKFVGTKKEIINMYLHWIIYTILTLGLFILFMNVLEEKYRIEHTIIKKDNDNEIESDSLDYVYKNSNKITIKILFYLGCLFIGIVILYIFYQSILLLILANILLSIELSILYRLIDKYLSFIKINVINKLCIYYVIFLCISLLVFMILYFNNIIRNLSLFIVSLLVNCLTILNYYLFSKRIR